MSDQTLYRPKVMADYDHVPSSEDGDVTTSGYVVPMTTSNLTETNGFYFYQEEQLTFLYILFVLIVTGNCLVIVAILSSKNRKSRMHIFILNLAFADLSAGLVNVLTDIVWKNTVDWYAGVIGCKVVRYGQSVVTYGSTYALVALSIDRLNAIARPMSFSSNKFRTRLLIGLAWLLSLVFSIPMLVINELQDMGNQGLQCGIEFPQVWNWKLYITVIAVVVFFIPAIIIAVCYIIIVVIIWKKTSSGGGMTSSPNTTTTTTTTTTTKTSQFVKSGGQMYVAISNSHFREGNASSRGVIPRAKIKTIKMTLVIVLVFVVCWSPYFVFDILAVYGLSANNRQYVAVATFMQSLAPLNSAANPLIYAIFNYNTCHRLFRRKQSDSTLVTGNTSRGSGTQLGARRAVWH